MEEPGLKHTEVWTVKDEWEVQRQLTLDILYTIYLRPTKTKSDLARYEASYIAALACQELITTQISPEGYSDTWRITQAGIAELIDEGRL